MSRAPFASRMVVAALERVCGPDSDPVAAERLRRVVDDFMFHMDALERFVAEGRADRSKVKTAALAIGAAYSCVLQDRVDALTPTIPTPERKVFLREFAPRLSTIRQTIARTRKGGSGAVAEASKVARAFLPALLLLEQAKVLTPRTRPARSGDVP